MVKNKTGDWYFGVVVLKNPNHPSTVSGSCAGLSKADLSDSFGFKRYDLRIFTGGQCPIILCSFLSSVWVSGCCFCYLVIVSLSGCYYFNSSSEEWDGRGVAVSLTLLRFSPFHISHLQVTFKDNVRIWTQCQTNHLTSYGTGFFKTQNAIDFDFIFADFDYADHMTVFIVLLVTLILFLITLIWAQIHDHM